MLDCSGIKHFNLDVHLESGRQFSNGGTGYQPESNYANIQINIAPPTPTAKDFNFDSGYDQGGNVKFFLYFVEIFCFFNLSVFFISYLLEGLK